MSVLDSFTNWAAATFYTDPADVQTHQDVAAAQQKIVDQQYADNKRNVADYYTLSQDINAAGNYQADFVAENSGVFGFLKIIPWWLWLAIIIAGVWYVFGFGWITAVFAKKAK